MKWILCGKNDAAVRVVEFLHGRGDEVWAIGTLSDNGSDGWQLSFRGRCEALGIAFDQPESINESKFIDRMAEFLPHALISIQYDQILRDSLLGKLEFPCLNMHFALLPRHRGVAPIPWAIISGDKLGGVTLHHMIPEIDAGDVVAQHSVEIALVDDARTLYDRVSDATVALFRECYPFSDQLLNNRVTQPHGQAVYHKNGELDFDQRSIDWHRPAVELQRWIRAMIFPPLQLPEVLWQGLCCTVSRVGDKVSPTDDHKPGTVVAKDEQWLVIAALNGCVQIGGIEPANESRDVTSELQIGDRLAVNNNTGRPE